MNCDLAQRSLVTSDEPARPADEVVAHLSDCSVCRDVQRQILQLEHYAALLPVPPSDAKARFLRKLAAGKPTKSDPAIPARPAPSHVLRIAHRPTTKERGLKKLSFAFAMAAALVLFAVGWWAWQREEQPLAVGPRPAPAADPLVAKLLQRDLRLASAKTPRERVETLAELADDLQGGIRSLAHSARVEDIRALTEMYKEVVGKGIVTHARTLPAAERAGVLEPIASRLLRVGNEADLLAEELPPESAKALREVAAVARLGDEKLRQLVQEVRG